MRIQHNIASMNAYRNYNNNTRALSKNLEKLSSGYKINRAGDDAAGLAISEKMRAQITGLNAAQKNVKDGVSLVKTAEGAMQEIHDMLNRMDYLATQSANGTYDNEVDRANLQKEVASLKDEINRIADSANFNGIKLLDGSLDSTVKTKMNEIAESFGIADWVGSTANNDAVVGTGTIVHTGSKEAVGTEFAIEFNNSTVSGTDGVSITIGDNEKISLDGTEIAQGASADEIAAAFEKKLNGEVELSSTGGEKVKFNVKADGDRLVFTQAEAPTSSKQVVNGNMAVKYEGIGGGVTKAEALNTTELKANIDSTKNEAKVGTVTFAWDNKATDEAKDALNKALGDGVEIKATIKADATTVTSVAAGGRTVDISALQAALGDGFTITAKEGTGNTINDVIKPSDKGVITTTAAKDQVELTVKDADGNNVGKLTVNLAATANAFAAGTAAGTIATTKFTLNAGNNKAMNGDPAIEVADDGKMATTADPNGMFAFESITPEQKDALNQAIADGGSITIKLSDLTGNKAVAGTKVNIELSQALKDAGYYITNDPSTAANAADPTKKYNEETGYTAVAGDVGTSGTNKVFGLCDKDGNLIAKFTLATKDDTTAGTGASLTSEATTINLTASKFNSETAKTSANGGLKETVQVKLTAATPADDTQDPTDISSIDWNGAATISWNDGDKLTMTIGGTDYEVTMKNGGLTQEETDSGKFIDISTAANVDTGAEVRALLVAAVQKQMNAEASEAAKGNDDYTKTTALTFAANADDPTKIDVTGTTQRFTYVGDTAADDTTAPGTAVPGGKDPNASTVNIKQGATATDGRLASTYLEASDFAGLKDGSQLRVGDVTYTFAVGKDSKVTGENVVDLTDMEASDADLLEKALVRLTEAGNPNAMFSIGNDEPGRVTFTENKDYTWGEGVDLSTHKGIAEQFGFYVDGVSTSGASGKSLTLQIGDTSDDFNQMKVSVGDMHTTGMGIEGVDISTQEGAAAAVDVIKNAINYVSSVRGDLGAIQNRLEHTQNNLSVMAENIQDAESTIRDTDVAEEMMSYVKNNILVQSAQAMLAQANQLPQGVLQLLG